MTNKAERKKATQMPVRVTRYWIFKKDFKTAIINTVTKKI